MITRQRFLLLVIRGRRKRDTWRWDLDVGAVGKGSGVLCCAFEEYSLVHGKKGGFARVGVVDIFLR